MLGWCTPPSWIRDLECVRRLNEMLEGVMGARLTAMIDALVQARLVEHRHEFHGAGRHRHMAEEIDRQIDRRIARALERHRGKRSR